MIPGRFDSRNRRHAVFRLAVQGEFGERGAPEHLGRLTGAPVYRDVAIPRPNERARLDAMVAAGHRLILVHGPPGVGKTRLAVEWASTAAGPFERGAFSSLASCRDNGEVSISVEQVVYKVEPKKFSGQGTAKLLREVPIEMGPVALELKKGEGQLGVTQNEVDTLAIKDFEFWAQTEIRGRTFTFDGSLVEGGLTKSTYSFKTRPAHLHEGCTWARRRSSWSSRSRSMLTSTTWS